MCTCMHNAVLGAVNTRGRPKSVRGVENQLISRYRIGMIVSSVVKLSKSSIKHLFFTSKCKARAMNAR